MFPFRVPLLACQAVLPLAAVEDCDFAPERSSINAQEKPRRENTAWQASSGTQRIRDTERCLAEP
jgi:hypothetical protein